jgi:hypothetical protein
LKITVEFIPHPAQRYDTLGDWRFDPEGNLTISISDSGSYRSNICLALHELVEALLCRWDGVSTEDVDRWDMSEGKDSDEPGEDPRAPYHVQHMRAMIFERLLADMLALPWPDYEALLARMAAGGDKRLGSTEL